MGRAAFEKDAGRRNAAFALGKMGPARRAIPAVKAAYAQESDAKSKDALLRLGEICRDMDVADRDATLESIFIDALKFEHALRAWLCMDWAAWPTNRARRARRS